MEPATTLTRSNGPVNSRFGVVSGTGTHPSRPAGELSSVTQGDLILPLLATGVLAVVMCLGWLVQRRTRNAGIVDLLWVLGLLGLASTYALVSNGWAPRRILVLGLVLVWGARLARHILRRLLHESEDGRYAELRARRGDGFQRTMLGIFLAQALIAGLLSIAYLVPMSAADVGVSLRDGAAVLIWLVAWTGEAIADRQLHAWRSNPANAGRTCRTGLWRFSRHPNYFFEWLMWLAFPVLSIGLPWGPVTWVAPLLMLVLVVGVTGIPPTERQALKSRGDDYRDYQRTTSAFIPWPPCPSDAAHIRSSRESFCA